MWYEAKWTVEFDVIKLYIQYITSRYYKAVFTFENLIKYYIQADVYTTDRCSWDRCCEAVYTTHIYYDSKYITDGCFEAVYSKDRFYEAKEIIDSCYENK